MFRFCPQTGGGIWPATTTRRRRADGFRAPDSVLPSGPVTSIGGVFFTDSTAIMAVPKVNILGTEIAALNLPAAREATIARALSGQGGYICVTGAHGVIEARDDASFRRILNGSVFNTPDGMPNVWMGRHFHGVETMDRVYGPDLMREVIDLGRERGLRHFLFGGKEGVSERLRNALRERFPGVEISGIYTPPFRPLNGEEAAEFNRAIDAADPHLIWIGLSTPKQERFMAEWAPRLPGRLMIGVGAAFDFHAGLVSSAPPVLQRAGLEWLYRLVTEPRRLWPRYSRIVPRFLWGALGQVAGPRQDPHDDSTGTSPEP